MSTQAWSAPPDPRQGVQVGLARVRVGWPSTGAAQPSTMALQQRVEDALRCATLGDGRRLVLIRKLQVKSGSVLAPGWSDVLEAAAQDVISRACHGRFAVAERAEAVWFESWDDAVGAWLDVALGVGGLELSANAWYWPRIARMAGLPAAPAGSSSGGASPGRGGSPALSEQARAMWERWQADPISQRACRDWIAQRPGVLGLLTGAPEAPVIDVPVDSAQPMRVGDATQPLEAFRAWPVLDLAGHDSLPKAPELLWRVQEMAQALSPEALAGHEPAAHLGLALDPQGKPDAVPTQAPSSVPDGLDGKARSGSWASTQSDASSSAGQPEAQAQPHGLVHGDRTRASADETRFMSGGVETPLPSHQATPSLPSLVGSPEASSPTFRALGWTHLRFTQFGGLPFTLRALQGLGFAHALSERVRVQEGVDAHMAASAPWLYLWARLGPHARQQWVRDPMFSALPAFERVEDLPVQDHARELLACWMDQPASVRTLGQQAWGSLHRAMRHKGWRSAVELLQRPAWMQLSHTHLDVLFTLDQADLNVRRLGLDADPGWVPWLGRIVSLHFEPACDLPAMPAALQPWSAP